jgi:O-antigen ligase
MRNPLWGYGVGSSNESLDSLFVDVPSTVVYGLPHNLVLKIWMELGLVGLFLFLAVIGLPLIKTWLYLRSPTVEFNDRLRLTLCLSIMFVFFGQGVTGSGIIGFPVVVWFWLCAGILIGNQKREVR